VSTYRARRAPCHSLTWGVLCLAPAAWLAFGCSRQPDLDEVFEPARPHEPAAGTAPARSEFELAPGSRVEFWLGPRARELHGSLGVAHSRLQIDPAQPSATRGSVTFDLVTLAFDPPADNAWRPTASAGADSAGSLTEQSLRWLEISPAATLTEHPELRFARFLIRDVTAAESSAGRPPAAGDPQAPRAWTISGELELHGVRAPYTLPLSVSFYFPSAAAGAAPGPPQRLDITTRGPARISLSAHALVPRNEHGDILAELLIELRKSRVDEVRLGARWTATAVSVQGAVSAP
jgi:hypothetical protein